MWQASAPSNIALIKYMGKSNFDTNLPTNASLSYTLNHLRTEVQLSEANYDHWLPLRPEQKISESGQVRFLNYLARLKAHYGYEGGFCVKSANNFPTGAGIASSASSFAALTMVATQALSELTGKDLLSWEQQSQFSRTGSGSSIRSFYSPWALWRGDTCYNIELPYPELIHQVILIKSEPKKISSSEAHRLIETSPIFAKRMKTVELKLDDLVTAIACKDWKVAYEIVRDEFIEMHELFHTCEKPFSYMQDESKQIIAEVDAHWQQHGDGPMITMDAGPNIHLLYRPDQAELADQFKTQYGARFDVI